jgi:hypothetical protein
VRAVPKVGIAPKASRAGARKQGVEKQPQHRRRKLPGGKDVASGVALKKGRKAVRQDAKAAKNASEAEGATETQVDPAAVGGDSEFTGDKETERLARDGGRATAAHEPVYDRRDGQERHLSTASQQPGGEPSS